MLFNKLSLHITTTLFLCLSVFAASTFEPAPQIRDEVEVKTLEIGAKAPDFKLPDLKGTFRSLDDYADAKVLTIVFTCNHCPTAQAYEDRLIEYTDEYRDQGVQVVAISPNSVKGLLFEECGYTDLNDTYEEMIIRAEYKGYNFPYLYDGDNHDASVLYGPTTTPHVFVFDEERTLQYVGRIDAHEKPGTANAEDLRAATDAILAGETPELQTTKAFGCSVKWSWNSQWAKTVNERWAEAPVTLDNLSLEQAAELVKNETDQLRLINVWATWCAPCVIEYPDFVNTHRMYMGRDFEFVSISMDNMNKKKNALKFLDKTDSALQNYIYEGSDKYAFIEALDPDWNGALPYTMLIEPGGNVVWSHQGPVDFLELRRAIVDHPMIGRFF